MGSPQGPETTGVFGGRLTFEQGRSFEEAPAPILAILEGTPVAGESTEAARAAAGLKGGSPPSADLVRFHAASGRVEHGGDLAGLVPITSAVSAGMRTPDVVAVLAQVASALSALHAAGEAHGDLGPWSIRVGDGRVALLVPPPGVPAGALVAARIRHTGAPLRDVAFCSGGTLEGHEGGPANDVYAFAGLTHWLVSGELPVGHVDVSAAAQGPLRELARVVAAGLAATPAVRPPMAALQEALSRTAKLMQGSTPHAAAGSATPSEPERTNVPDAGAARSGAPAESAAADFRADPRRARGGSAAGLSAPNTPYSTGAGPTPQARPGQAPWNPPGPEARPEGRQLSTVLTLLLVVGGLFVLVGALWIVAVGWAILGEGGRAGLLFALTAGIAGGGFALEKRGYRSSGFALVVLASQMLWADGGYVLNLADALSSVGAWAGVAGFVTAVSALLAVNRKSIGAAVLTALGFAVFAICFNVATGRPGQLAFFSALTLASFLAGLLALRRDRATTSTALLVLGAQLLWIDAGCFLDLVESLSSTPAWTVAAGVVFAVSLGVALARRSPVAGLFAALNFLVFASLFAHATGRPGQLGLMVAITLTAAIVGVQQARKGRELLGAALVLGATQLLWIDAALLLDLDMVHLVTSTGAWTVASGLVLGTTYAVTLARHPSGALLAAFDGVIFTACLGVFLSRGEPLGPPLYAFGVAWLYVGLAAGAHFAKRPGATVVLGAFGLFAALGSAFLGTALLASSEDHLVFGSLWALAPLGSLLVFAFRGVESHRTIARAGTAVLLATIPVTEAVLRPNDSPYVVIAALIGAGAVFVALRLPTWQIQIAGTFIGVMNAVLVPSAAFLDKCLGDGGLHVLLSPAVPYMIAALGAPIALLLAAAFSSPDTTRRAGYRFVEVAALLQLFGLTTLASLVRSEDFFYPAAILLTGTFALALGVARRHVVIVALASGALLLNLWIQYFQKLRDTFPTAVLVIGFGIGLLVAGVIYERKIRHVLPKLKEWS